MTTPRHVTAEVRSLIEQWEGFVGYTYDDAEPRSPHTPIKPGTPVRGTLTIGYGHTGAGVLAGMTCTKPQADAWLSQDLAFAENAVASAVTVPLTDNQFGALVSFCFNVGAQAFKTSTLLRLLNDGKYADVPAQLARWNKSQGRKNLGLVNRRAAEAGLWAKGGWVQSSGTEASAAPQKITPTEIAAGAGSIIGPAAGFANSTGVVAWAFAAAVVIVVLVLAAVFIRRQFFAK